MIDLFPLENVTISEVRILEKLYNEYYCLKTEEDNMNFWNFNALKDTLEYLREKKLIKSVITSNTIKYEITYSGIQYYENILSNIL